MSYQLANNLFYVGMSANEKKNFLSHAEAQLDFSSEDIHTKQFKYSSKGWVGRKIAAIPSALICGVVKTIYHLMKAFLISFPKTICSNKPYFKKEIFYAVRDLHEAYGRFICLFNDHQGLFHIHKSQLHKIAYNQFFIKKESLSQPTNPSANPKSQGTSQIPSSYPSLLDDETLHPDLLKQLPSKFIRKIESSKEYSLTEKQLLKSAALKIYTSDDKVIQPTDLTYQHMTNRNLIGLKSKYPHFYIIDSINQWADHDLPQSISSFLTDLDKTAPYEIYGQLVQVNGNHRTACMIDRVNGTVEYYNSFDDDQNVKDNLTELAKKLTEKFGKKFTYSFRTRGLHLQTDGYQCGNWAAKFIEERIKPGKNFDPKDLENYDIAAYRKKIFARAFKTTFYQEVGSARYKAKKLAFFKKYTDKDKEMLTRVARNEQALLKSNSLKDLDASGIFFDSSRRTFADTFALQLSKGDKKAETFAEKLFEKIEKDLYK